MQTIPYMIHSICKEFTKAKIYQLHNFMRWGSLGCMLGNLYDASATLRPHDTMTWITESLTRILFNLVYAYGLDEVKALAGMHRH